MLFLLEEMGLVVSLMGLAINGRDLQWVLEMCFSDSKEWSCSYTILHDRHASVALLLVLATVRLLREAAAVLLIRTVHHITSG